MSTAIKLYNSGSGLIAQESGSCLLLPAEFTLDRLFGAPDPLQALREQCALGSATALPETLLAPIGRQEVWAAGVTYQRSRVARVAESTQSGGAVFYDKVYEAARPELFFKATPHRVAAPGTPVCIRADATWNVPEPELTLAINAQGKIFGYTIGNDMSSRDIEGENPLYLPQAKCYDRSAALGPCLLITDLPPAPATPISIEILRGGAAVFSGATALDRMKRSLPELAAYLFRSNSFPAGCFLMTGTGIVPGDNFTLQVDDVVAITIPPIGTLVNPVALAP